MARKRIPTNVKPKEPVIVKEPVTQEVKPAPKKPEIQYTRIGKFHVQITIKMPNNHMCQLSMLTSTLNTAAWHEFLKMAGIEE